MSWVLNLDRKEYILTKTSYLSEKRSFEDKRKTIHTNFEPYYKKLKDTIILNEDYTNVIKNYDSPTTFFYLDPPYENSKKSTRSYVDICLEELANILSTLQGKFLLSLNKSERTLELFKNFKINEVETKYCMRSDRISPVIELIITNYDVLIN
jgi:DNA adenine methylase